MKSVLEWPEIVGNDNKNGKNKQSEHFIIRSTDLNNYPILFFKHSLPLSFTYFTSFFLIYPLPSS